MQVKLSLSEIRAEIQYLKNILEIVKGQDSSPDALDLVKDVEFSLHFISKHVKEIERHI